MAAARGAGIGAVLFDFDGTFADTAPDMVRALNTLLASHRLPAVALSDGRPYVSSGARGMIEIGFGLLPGSERYEALRDAFHNEYERNMCIDTAWFDGIEAVVSHLESRQIRWGIVTNKAARFALPLAEQLSITTRAACVVCGDTTPHTKPHPAPLLHAASLLDIEPAACLYVGDDQRDMRAASAAGMRGVAARYGYIGSGNDPAGWGAAAVIDTPMEILALLG